MEPQFKQEFTPPNVTREVDESPPLSATYARAACTECSRRKQKVRIRDGGLCRAGRDRTSRQGADMTCSAIESGLAIIARNARSGINAAIITMVRREYPRLQRPGLLRM